MEMLKGYNNDWRTVDTFNVSSGNDRKKVYLMEADYESKVCIETYKYHGKLGKTLMSIDEYSFPDLDAAKSAINSLLTIKKHQRYIDMV